MADYKVPIITGTALTTGDLLRWNGTAWVNYPDSNYSGGYVNRGDPSKDDFRLKRESGTATSTSADHLVDNTAQFQLRDCAVGEYVHNTTDNTWAMITAVNSETDLTLDTDIMVNGESYYAGAFKTDGGKYEWDLSALVPAGATAIDFVFWLADDATGSYLMLLPGGSSNTYNRGLVRTQVAGLRNDISCLIACDVDRKIQYLTSNTTFTEMHAIIKGWII